MAAFDEDTGDAVRKYFFFVDEKAQVIPFRASKWHTCRFDAQLILDKDVLEKPYADEKLRSIAIFKEIQKQFGKDIAKVLPDNKMLGICQMVVNESLRSGIIAAKRIARPGHQILIQPQGFDFDSRNLYAATFTCMKKAGS